MQVVSFVNVYFSSIICFDLAELTCHLLPPPLYMNHKTHAAPSRGFNSKEARQLTTPMVSFVIFYFVNYLIGNDHP